MNEVKGCFVPKKDSCLTIKELRKIMEQYPDDAKVMVVASGMYRRAFQLIPHMFETRFGNKVLLLNQNTTTAISYDINKKDDNV